MVDAFLNGRVMGPLGRLSRVSREVTGVSFDLGCGKHARSRINVLKRDVGAVSSGLRGTVSRLGKTGTTLLKSVSGGRGVSEREQRFVSGISRRLGAPVSVVRTCTRKLGRVRLSGRDHRCCYSMVLSRTQGVGILVHGLVDLVEVRSKASHLSVSRFSVARRVHSVIGRGSVLSRRGNMGIRFGRRAPICI